MDGPVTQGEVNQKEKNKYHVLTHIYGIQKNSTDEPIHRAGIENTRMDTVGRGWGGLREKHWQKHTAMGS